MGRPVATATLEIRLRPGGGRIEAGEEPGTEMGQDHLATMIRDSVRAHGARTAMRWKAGGAWRSLTYAELGERIRAVARALLESGVGEGDRVGVFARNSPEWAIADLAILSVRAVAVPIYATNTARQARYVVEDAGLRLVFAGDQDQLDKIMSFRAAAPRLRQVVVLDPAARPSGEGCLRFDELLRLGAASTRDAELDARLAAAAPDDVASLIYTSGTTGEPKGAVLAHAGFFHQFRAIDDRFTVGPSDRSLCFLPLSHAYERTWSYYVFRQGAVNHYLADPRDVVAALPDVRPTVMVSVPRLYEKICAAVVERAARSSPPRRALFRWAMRVVAGTGTGAARAGESARSSRSSTGSPTRSSCSGSARWSEGRRTSSRAAAPRCPGRSRSSSSPRASSCARATASPRPRPC